MGLPATPTRMISFHQRMRDESADHYSNGKQVGLWESLMIVAYRAKKVLQQFYLLLQNAAMLTEHYSFRKQFGDLRCDFPFRGVVVVMVGGGGGGGGR